MADRPPGGETAAGGGAGGPAAPPDSTPGERPEESGDGPLPLVLLLSVAGIAAIAGAVWASRRAGRQAA